MGAGLVRVAPSNRLGKLLNERCGNLTVFEDEKGGHVIQLLRSRGTLSSRHFVALHEERVVKLGEDQEFNHRDEGSGVDELAGLLAGRTVHVVVRYRGLHEVRHDAFLEVVREAVPPWWY